MTDDDTSDVSLEEIPFAGSLMEIASGDLAATRTLVQRLVAAQDALLATSTTIATLLAGLAFSAKSAIPALVGASLVIIVAYIDAIARVHTSRATHRLRVVERLFNSYVKVLRERGAARPQAVQGLRREIRRYSFGTEQAFEAVRLTDIWSVNRSRARSYFHVCLAVAMVVVGVIIWSSHDDKEPLCVLVEGGGVARVDEAPRPAVGALTIEPCPSPVAPTPSSVPEAAPSSSIASLTPTSVVEPPSTSTSASA
jgi:hypothetical protein